MTLFTEGFDQKVFSTILDATDLGFWKIYFNVRTGVGRMYFNNKMKELMSSPEEITPEELYFWWFNNIDDYYKPAVEEIITRVLTTDEKKFELEYSWHNKNGRRSARVRGALIDMQGEIAYVVGYHQDVSEYHDTRVQLTRQLRNFEVVCDIGKYAVFELERVGYDNYSKEFRIFVNEKFPSMFGLTKASIDVLEWAKLAKCFSPAQGDIWLDLLDHTKWLESEEISHEMPCTLYDGTEIWISITYKIISDIQDNCSRKRLVGFISDISDVKKNEQVLEEARDIAEQASISKSIFLANMSHEIRTPMNSIINFSNFMTDTKLSKTQEEYVSKILSSSTHMLNILNDILDFSKIEADKMVLENVPFYPKKEYNGVYDIISSGLIEKNIVYHMTIDEDIPEVLVGDDMRVRQVLINLLNNATKFTSDYGAISFDICKINKADDSQWLRYIVKDSGIGMTESQLDKLFVAFTQADSSITRKYGGTGLGLSISYKLVNMMGGNVTVESAVNVGTSFTVEIPFRLPTEEEIESLKSHNLNKNIDANTKFQGIQCLVAEDNLINQQVVRIVLEMIGIHPVIVNDGREALEEFKRHWQDYDCIFMDLQMPIMDGYTATKRIRRLDIPKSNTIPIFALTANAIRGDDIVSLKAGMNVHLTKPLVKEDIIRTLAEYFPDKVCN